MSYVLAFAGFMVLIVLHELGHFLAAKSVGMRVERFSLFFPPLLLKKRWGETEYAIGAIPLGGYVKITGMNSEEDIPDEIRPQAYYTQPVWKRVWVITAGPLMNIIVAVLIFTGIYMFAVPKAIPVVDKTLSGSPASEHLMPGDRFISINGLKATVENVHNQVAGTKCAGKREKDCVATEPVKLVIVRGGKRVTLSVYPRYDVSAKPHAMRLGFQFDRTYTGYGLITSVGKAFATSWFITKGTFKAIANIFNPKQRDQISGVVGTYKATQQSFSFSVPTALFILGLISLSLAIINLFPFLPLDGGHIFFALAEKVRGKPISIEIMQRASVVGFMLVVMLFVIGLSNDIGRLTGDGFNIR